MPTKSKAKTWSDIDAERNERVADAIKADEAQARAHKAAQEGRNGGDAVSAGDVATGIVEAAQAGKGAG